MLFSWKLSLQTLVFLRDSHKFITHVPHLIENAGKYVSSSFMKIEIVFFSFFDSFFKKILVNMKHII